MESESGWKKKSFQRNNAVRKKKKVIISLYACLPKAAMPTGGMCVAMAKEKVDSLFPAQLGSHPWGRISKERI